MSRAVYEDDVIKLLNRGWKSGVYPLACDVRALPPAQPEPKKGKWIINSDGYYPYCSECRKEPKNGDMTDFCPNCGADMRGEQDEH